MSCCDDVVGVSDTRAASADAEAPYLPRPGAPYLSKLGAPYLSGSRTPYFPGSAAPYLSGSGAPYLSESGSDCICSRTEIPQLQMQGSLPASYNMILSKNL